MIWIAGYLLIGLLMAFIIFGRGCFLEIATFTLFWFPALLLIIALAIFSPVNR